jgi:tryptophan synthase alpha chain
MSTVTGMNAIESKFKANSNPLFIPFITCGDPTIAATVDIALSLQEAGADILELGVPYSDPLADGPTIQKASARALRNHVSILDCLQAAGIMREKGLHIPVVLFTYYNPVLQFGPQKVFQEMERAGIDGLLIPDLPVEESSEIKALSNEFNKPLISLVAPTSATRIEKIAAQAAGFIYCVSSLGVTGARTELPKGVDTFLATVKSHANVPVAVGFGISTAEQVGMLSPHCDGIIVGSAIIQKIERLEDRLVNEETRESALDEIKIFVQNLKTAVR